MYNIIITRLYNIIFKTNLYFICLIYLHFIVLLCDFI